MDYYYVDGYAFEDRELYNKAIREQRNIEKIRVKMNMENKDSVLLIYKKLVTRNLLTTPIGIAFLHELQDMLIKDFKLKETDIPMIKIPKIEAKTYDKSIHVKEQLVKDIKKKNRIIFYLKIIITGCIVLIIGIFIITVKNPNVQYINYENKILDKYSKWDEQLKKREAVVKTKESKLGIDSNNSDNSSK